MGNECCTNRHEEKPLKPSRSNSLRKTPGEPPTPGGSGLTPGGPGVTPGGPGLTPGGPWLTPGGPWLTPGGPEPIPISDGSLPVASTTSKFVNDPQVIDSETFRKENPDQRPGKTQGRDGERRSFGLAMKNEWCMIRDKTVKDSKNRRGKSLPRSSVPILERNSPSMSTPLTPRNERHTIDSDVFETRETAPEAIDWVEIRELDAEKAAFKALDFSGSKLLAEISALMSRIKALRVISAEKSDVQGWDKSDFPAYISFLSGHLKRVLTLLKRPEASYPNTPLASNASYDNYDSRIRELETFLTELKAVRTPNPNPDPAWFLVIRTMVGRRGQLSDLQTSLGQFHTDYQEFSAQIQSQQKQLSRLPQDSEEVEKVLMLEEQIGDLEHQSKIALEGSQEVAAGGDLVLKALSQLEHLAADVQTALKRDREDQAEKLNVIEDIPIAPARQEQAVASAPEEKTFSFDLIDLEDDQLETEKTAFQELDSSGSRLLDEISALLSRVNALRTISAEKPDVQEWDKDNYPIYISFLSGLGKRALALLKRPEVAYLSQPLASDASFDDYDSRIRAFEEFLGELRSVQTPNPTPDPAWDIVTRTIVGRKGELGNVQTSLGRFHTEYEAFSAQVRSQQEALSSLPQDSEEVQKVILLERKIGVLENHLAAALEGSLEVAKTGDITLQALSQVGSLSNEVETALRNHREGQAEKATFSKLETSGARLLVAISALLSRVKALRIISAEKSDVQIWDKENYPTYISFLSELRKRAFTLLKRPEVAYPNQPLASDASYDDYDARILILEEVLGELRSVETLNPSPDPAWHMVIRTIVGRKGELGDAQINLGRFHTEYEAFSTQVRSEQEQLSSLSLDNDEVQKVLFLEQKIGNLEKQSKTALEGSLDVAEQGEMTLNALSQVEHLVDELETELQRDREEQAKKAALHQLDTSGSRLFAATSALLSRVKALRNISAEKSDVQEWDKEDYPTYISFLSELLKRVLAFLKRPEVGFPSQPLAPEASIDDYDSRIRIMEEFLTDLRSVQSPNPTPDPAWLLVIRTLVGRRGQLGDAQTSLGRLHTEYDPFSAQVRSQQEQISRLSQDSKELQKVLLLEQQIGVLEKQSKAALEGSLEVVEVGELTLNALAQLEHLADEVETALRRDREEQLKKVTFQELNSLRSRLLAEITALLLRLRTLRVVSADNSTAQEWDKENYPVYTAFLSGLLTQALALLKRPEVAYLSQPLASDASSDDYDTRTRIMEEFLSELKSVLAPNPTPEPAWLLVTQTMAGRLVELRYVQGCLGHFHTEFELFSARVRNQQGLFSSVAEDREKLQDLVLLVRKIGDLESQSKAALEGSLEVAVRGELVLKALSQIEQLTPEVETAVRRDREEQIEKVSAIVKPVILPKRQEQAVLAVPAENPFNFNVIDLREDELEIERVAFQKFGASGSRLLATISALLLRLKTLRIVSTENSTAQEWDKENYPVYTAFLSELLKRALALLKRPEVAYSGQPLAFDASTDDYDSRSRLLEQFLAELRSVQSSNPPPDPAWFLVTKTMAGRLVDLRYVQTNLSRFHTEYEPFATQVRSQQEQLSTLSRDSEEVEKVVVLAQQIGDLENQSKAALGGSLEVAVRSDLVVKALSQVESLADELETTLRRDRNEQVEKAAFRELDTSGSGLLVTISALLSTVKALRIISAEKSDVQVWDKENYPAYISFLAMLRKRALALLKRPEVAYSSQPLASDASFDDSASRIRELEEFLGELRSVQTPNPTPDPAWDMVTRTIVERKGGLGDVQTSLGRFHTEYEAFSAQVRSQQEELSSLPQDSDEVQKVILLDRKIGDLEKQSKTAVNGSLEVAAQGELTVQAFSQLEQVATEVESALQRDREDQAQRANSIEEIALVPVRQEQAFAPEEPPSDLELDLFQDQDRLLFLASIRPGILYALSLKLPLDSSETVELSDLALSLSLVMQRHANSYQTHQQIERTVLEHFIENYRKEDVMMKLSAFLQALIVNSLLDYISLMVDLLNVHPPPYPNSPELLSSFSLSFPKAKDVFSPSSSSPEAWGETGGTIKTRTVLDLLHHMTDISTERGGKILKMCKPEDISELDYTKYILLFAFRMSSTESYRVSKRVFATSSKRLERSEIVSNLHSLPHRHFLTDELLSDLMTSFLAPGCKTLAQKEFTKNLVMNALVAADSDPAYVLPLITFLRAFVATRETEPVEISLEF